MRCPDRVDSMCVCAAAVGGRCVACGRADAERLYLEQGIVATAWCRRAFDCSGAGPLAATNLNADVAWARQFLLCRSNAFSHTQEIVQLFVFVLLCGAMAGAARGVYSIALAVVFSSLHL